MINAKCPHRVGLLFYQLQVFGSTSPLIPLIGVSGGLVCESEGKEDLLSDHFDSKQSRYSVDLLLSCHLSPSVTPLPLQIKRD